MNTLWVRIYDIFFTVYIFKVNVGDFAFGWNLYLKISLVFIFFMVI